MTMVNEVFHVLIKLWSFHCVVKSDATILYLAWYKSEYIMQSILVTITEIFNIMAVHPIPVELFSKNTKKKPGLA